MGTVVEGRKEEALNWELHPPLKMGVLEEEEGLEEEVENLHQQREHHPR